MTTPRADIMDDSGGPSSAVYQAYPTWLKDRLEWFQDLKFGLFMHWGPYSQWGCIESWPLVEVDTWARPNDLPAWVERGRDFRRFQQDYWALNRTFNPTAFDPEPWAQAAARAGMTYVALTTKHHDGFCMFDTRTTDYRITHPSCPFHADPRANVARLVFDTFRRRGFGITCYFSKSDWHSPHYWWPGAPASTRNPNYDTGQHPERWEQFVQFAHAQVRELMTGYGHIDVLWLDGGQVRPPQQDLRMGEMAAMARALQPGLIMADRTVGGPHENILTPEQRIPDRPLDQPWESCLTMGNGWAYRPNDVYKDTRTLIHLLIDIVAKGGNLLLNVGPSPTGRFDDVPLRRLAEIGDWMQVNSEAIHGTRPVPPYKEGNICFTRRGGTVYGLILAAEGSDHPGAAVPLCGVQPAAGSQVRMLGVDRPLAWTRDGSVTRVVLPSAAELPCRDAWALRFAV